MKSKTVLLIITLFFIGCAKPSIEEMASNIANVSIGMTKKDVITVMGTPNSVSAINSQEYLNYTLCSKTGTLAQDYRCIKWNDYYIRLIDGKVESYGTKGDFDSTKIPESKKTIDMNIQYK